MKFYSELWEYREMIVSLVKRDLKSRYKGSVLGFFWMLLNPLMQLVVYTIVFSTIMRMGIEKFYLFLFVALVPWIFFSTCLGGGTGVILAQQDMVKKIYFPREVLPLSYAFSNFINMLLSFVVIFCVVLISGVKINLLAWLFLPLVMLIQLFLCIGITYLTSALNVYFRDLEFIMSIVSMAWMYLTPVIYPETMIPEQYLNLFYLNPMTPIVIAYRDILYYGEYPQMGILLYALGFSLVVMIVGHIVFRKLQRYFAEEL